MDRETTSHRFRERLRQVIVDSGLSQSGFAQAVGIDRSTLSQVLSSTSSRLPRVETLAAIANQFQVSLDWLVGLSEEGRMDANLLQQPLEISPAGTSPVDERLEGWHAEAMGYKIRHVPANLPDLLKTPEIIDFEYREAAGTTPEARLSMSENRLASQRTRSETDMEVCLPVQSLRGFARGDGIWSKLSEKKRRAQIETMIELTDELYPRFRCFLYDELQRYSAPLTIFGPLRAAIYIGQMYVVLTGREHIETLIAHFDELIRSAVVNPPEVRRFLTDLL